MLAHNSLIHTLHASPSGMPWPPRKDSKAHPLLILTGKLMNSAVGPGGDHVEIITPTSLEFGTDLYYADYHQFGTSRISARPFMGVSGEIVQECGKILMDYAAQELGLEK